MIKNVKKYYCDICKKEIQGEELHERITIPTVLYHDSNDGRISYPKGVYKQTICDLCSDCLDKVTTVVDDGIMQLDLKLRKEYRE